MKNLMCRVTLLAVAAAILLPSTVSLAADDVSFVVSGPVSSFTKENTWFERIATITNDTNSAKSVKINFMANDPQSGEVAYTRVLDVPAKAIRKSYIAFRPGQVVHSRVTQRANASDIVETELSQNLVEAETGVMLKKQISNSVLLEPARNAMVVVNGVACNHDTFGFLSGNKQAGDESGQFQITEFGPIQLSPERLSYLPDRWYGYDVCQFVIIGGMEVNNLRPSQIEAVLDWVRRGGVLVISSNEAMPLMMRSEFAQLAGVAVLGTHWSDKFAVQGNGKATEVSLAYSMPITELMATDATVAVEDSEGMPMLTRRQVGNGSIFVLSVPLMALEQPAMKPLLSVIGMAKLNRLPVDHNLFNQPVKMAADSPEKISPAGNALNSIAGRRGPDKYTPMTMLLVLTGLTVIGGGFLKFKRRGELLWLALVPLSLATGIGLFVFGLMNTQTERLSFIGLVNGNEDGTAHVKEVYAYYSGPKQQTASFTAGTSQGLIEPMVTTSKSPFNQLEIQTTETLSMPDQKVAQNSTCGFQTEALRPTGGMQMNLGFNETGLTGTIRNNLGVEVTDAVIYSNGRTYRLGSVANAADTAVVTTEKESLGRNEFTLSLAGSEGTLRSDFIKQVLARSGVTSRPISMPMLIGYSGQSFLSPLKDRKIDTQGWSIVAWPLQLQAPLPGKKVLIPEGFCNVNLQGAVWDASNQKFNETSMADRLTVRIAPPAGVELDKTTVRLSVNIRGLNFVMRVFGARLQNDKPVKSGAAIQEVANPSGKISITVANADRFRDRNGNIVLLIEVDKLDKAKVDVSEIQQIVNWQFESVDVALEGISR